MTDYHFWADRYKSQAQWTKQVREYILGQINLPKQSNVLEVGCGSLSILEEFGKTGFTSYGVDIDYSILRYDGNHPKNTIKINADGFELPFVDSYFDFCFCHYLLLWIRKPLYLIEEMIRVTKNSGWICCFAEPDYLSRIDAPEPLEQLGRIQNESLKVQGINLSTGRNIPNWFSTLGLTNINWGILGAENNSSSNLFNDQEWETMRKDVRDYLSKEELDEFHAMELKAQLDRTRVLFIPTFYAYAQVSKT
jgi:SAM-dependent methyltransferase